MKYFAAKVNPYNVNEENQMLLERLKVYEKMPDKQMTDENHFF